jgi:hypothetical protein
MTVQLQDLLAWSADGQITRNTFDLSGNFYIRVYNDDGSFDTSRQMSIVATVSGECGIPPQSGTVTPPLIKHSSQTSLTSGSKTLIITNTARLLGPNGKPLNDPTNTALLTSFNQTVDTFAKQPTVLGQRVDLANDNGLMQDYAEWDQAPFPSCPAAANVVASALHDLINAYRNQSGSVFQYVTILGGHTVIPSHLSPDSAELERENVYDPGLLDLSKSAASLANAYVMTDNYYVSLSPINRLESEISLPDANMAVGRIVEFPDDIMNVLQAFIDSGGIAHPTSALVTGYTFTTDLANFEAGLLKQSGVTTDSLISDSSTPPWTAPDLRAKLLGATTPDIVAVNWHAQSNEAVAADYATSHPTTISSSEIADLPVTDTRFKNRLIISLGCHLGYPLLNQDLIPNPTNPPQFVTEPRAFTETFQNRGAMVLANTGYGYGDTDFIGYGEELLALVTQQLADGAPSAVPVGLALTNAKRTYIQNSGATTGVDKKSIEELTFYGPPMWSIGLPARVANPIANPLAVNPVSADPAHALSAGTVTPPFTLTANLTQAGTTFYAADHAANDLAGGTQEIPYSPILPFKAFDVTAQSAGTARGVALISADYVDKSNTNVTVDVPVTEVSGARPPWPTPGFWPFQTFGLNELVGQELVTTPLQWQSADGQTGTTRKYNNSATTLRVYYSSLNTGAAFAGPATISNVNLSQNGTFLHVDLTVNGSTAADVFDVLVNYTGPPDATGTGHWKTCSLLPNRTDGQTTTASCLDAVVISTATAPGSFVRHYSGDLDPSVFGTTNLSSLRLALQAVTGTGLVSTRNNDGLYYSFVPPTATLANPKATTSITIGALTGSLTYGQDATFTATLHSASPSCSTANQPLTFNIGSQVKTVNTDTGGNASATINLLEVPSTYSLMVRFAETPTCLGSSAPAQSVTIAKQATSLMFSTSTPYIATLTVADSNNTPMRDRWVYFTFNGTSTAGATVTATRSAQTDANGVAELHGMTVPDGSYFVTASFAGSIPTVSGGVVNLSDPYYQGKSITTQTKVAVDRTPPTCTFNPGGSSSTSVVFTVQDTGSGLASVNAVGLGGGTFTISDPNFVAGVTTPLTVTITSANLSQVTLEVVDVAGNETDCFPMLVQVGRTTDLARRVVTTVEAISSQATIFNGTPGLQILHIKVGNNTLNVNNLLPGVSQTVDLSSLITGTNPGDPVVLTAEGKPGGSAEVVFTEQVPIGP